MSPGPSEASPALSVMFDHRIFIEQAHGGVSRYFAALAARLPQAGVRPRICAPLHINSYLEGLPDPVVWGKRVRPSRLTMAAGRRLGALVVPWAARIDRARVIHETFFQMARSGPRKTPVVLTVYDMIHELFSGVGGGERVIAWKKASIERADWIACISENTRRDLLRFYPQVADRVSVTLLGFDAVTPPPAPATGAAAGRPYLLFVGARGAYKNFAGLVEALAMSRTLKRDFDLVCVGGGAFSDEEKKALAAAGLDGRTRHVEADDRALSLLYGNAAAFVYPSLYEGFGIPPLEAMAAGCPVVTVRSSSIPEVCGDAVEYCEPGDSESLMAGIENVVTSPARAAALRAAGHTRTSLFSWERCAAQTAAIYRSLA